VFFEIDFDFVVLPRSAAEGAEVDRRDLGGGDVFAKFFQISLSAYVMGETAWQL